MTVPSLTFDPLYVAARRVLLDALDALVNHREAIVLAGAQAVYVRTGTADLDASVSPYTSDADLAIDPRLLGPDPRLEDAMRAAGFHPLLQPNGRTEPGIWTATATVNDAEVQIPVDLLVPDALSVGGGRRSARLPHHDANAARRTPGLRQPLSTADRSRSAASNQRQTPGRPRSASLAPAASSSPRLTRSMTGYGMRDAGTSG